jgi:hypothetical protein
MGYFQTNPEHQNQIRELRKITKELAEVHKLKNPNEIKEKFDLVQSQISRIENRLDHVEKTQRKMEILQEKIVSKQTDVIQRMLSEGLDQISKKTSEHIENNITQIKLDLLQLDFDFYKSDLRHLQDMNSYRASDTTEE